METTNIENYMTKEEIKNEITKIKTIEIAVKASGLLPETHTEIIHGIVETRLALETALRLYGLTDNGIDKEAETY